MAHRVAPRGRGTKHFLVTGAGRCRATALRYYLQRRDPDFEARKAEVLEVYAAAEMLRQMPEADRPVAVLSYDEKLGIQAIATTALDLPPKPGKHVTMQRDHEYKRLGTFTLSAVVDLVSGFVHHRVTERHRSREFIAFLERLDAHYPTGMLICLLLDNHSAHCTRETRCFLASGPGRFELVFTPTHASCLNYVETFFSRVARSVLRRIRVASKAELADRIRRYIGMCNAAPVLPRWRYGIAAEPQALAARFESPIRERSTNNAGLSVELRAACLVAATRAAFQWPNRRPAQA